MVFPIVWKQSSILITRYWLHVTCDTAHKNNSFTCACYVQCKSKIVWILTCRWSRDFLCISLLRYVCPVVALVTTNEIKSNTKSHEIHFQNEQLISPKFIDKIHIYSYQTPKRKIRNSEFNTNLGYWFCEMILWKLIIKTEQYWYVWNSAKHQSVFRFSIFPMIFF